MAKNLIYQLYPLTWGGFKEMEDFLYQIAELGVDYVWLSPVFPSPGVDHGYDVSDYKSVDPRHGNLGDFDNFVETAHQLEMGVLLDLVINHTSTEHKWFTTRPDYYYWGKADRPGWQNLFDGGSAWKQKGDHYYLHMFHEEQADLNWFPDGPDRGVNRGLLKEFREIINYWTYVHLVDGFRLDASQVINKDARDYRFDPVETVTKYRDMSVRVINELFDSLDSFLLVECLDLSGDMVGYYYENTPVSAVMDNTSICTIPVTEDMSVRERGLESFVGLIEGAYKRCPEGFAQVTESHDGPRIPSVAGIDGKTAIDILFGEYRGRKFSDPQTIVLYQGQELGLKNPPKDMLTDQRMCELDAESKMRFERGESLDELRPNSRANARVWVPLAEYDLQEPDENSCLNYTKARIKKWKAH